MNSQTFSLKPALRRLATLSIVVPTLAAAALSTPAPTRAAEDTLGAELMRLTNLDRQALGKPALAVDPTLAAFAAGASFTCPSNGAMTLHGRAADMAERVYFSHSIKDCRKSDGTEYGALDILLSRFGYNTYRGENIAWNNYPTTTTATYDTGCAIGTTSGCPGAETTAILSVVGAQQGFMNSAGHRANLLGDYDRFGCGSATTSAGRVYYACLFSKGGPATTTTTTTTTADTTATTTTTTTTTGTTATTTTGTTGTTTGTTTTTADTTRPRVTRETGKSAVYTRGSSRRFYATLSDNRTIRSASVYLDGRRLGTWSWSGTVGSARRSILVSSSRLTRGTHTLVWRVRDRAGNVSTVADGKVVFTVR